VFAGREPAAAGADTLTIRRHQSISADHVAPLSEKIAPRRAYGPMLGPSGPGSPFRAGDGFRKPSRTIKGLTVDITISEITARCAQAGRIFDIVDRVLSIFSLRLSVAPVAELTLRKCFT
jgi:hypothetical protein